MTDDDYDALSQKQLASIKRDTRISFEDAAVRATHKVMAELQPEVLTGESIERFAALVRADEREACAKVCDELNFIDNGTPANTRATNRHCAAAIRARGNT